MKILILDSNPRWLSHWAAQGASIASTLADALAAIEAGTADTVIIDRLDVDIIPILTQAGASVIVCSWLDSNDEAIEAYRAGAAGYVARSYEMTVRDIEAMIREGR